MSSRVVALCGSDFSSVSVPRAQFSAIQHFMTYHGGHIVSSHDKGYPGPTGRR